MTNLSLVKSDNFGAVKCDFWQNQNGDVFMTINQLAQALEYADKSGVEKILQRNEYLKQGEFSVTDRLSAPDGKLYDTRIFTEDGVYEVTMLSKQPKARLFRSWVREILKSLRKDEVALTFKEVIKKHEVEARLKNAKVREANVYLKIADKVKIAEYQQIMYSKATEVLSGQPLLPLPEVGEKTYTATEIGRVLGISANKVGRLANANNLKTSKFGKLFYDKSSHSNKEVETFRYYENVIPVLKKINM